MITRKSSHGDVECSFDNRAENFSAQNRKIITKFYFLSQVKLPRKVALDT